MSETKEFEPLKVADCNASDLFIHESVDWKYCKEHASFSHREYCEFVIHTFHDDDDYFEEVTKKEMADYGCTKEFISTIERAREQGFEMVLLYS